MHPQQSSRSLTWEPTCSPCPSTVLGLNLKPWLSSGLVLAGESLSDLRQWDCLSFGEQRRRCIHHPGKAAPAARGGRLATAMPCQVPATQQQGGGTYQDNRADVGRQQDVVPQRTPITFWLHMGGTFVVELERTGGREVGPGTHSHLLSVNLSSPWLAVQGALQGAPQLQCTHILTVTWHQTQCRPVMPW